MKRLALIGLFLVTATAFAQQHDASSGADGMKGVSFLVGDWTGTQKFNNPNGAPMQATVSSKIAAAVGGRFLQETIRGTLPGRPAFETIHMMSFDPAKGEYHAWWFNDTSRGPSEYVGKVEGDTLTMLSVVKNPGAPQLRVTYAKAPDHGLRYRLEMHRGEEWVKLFETTYSARVSISR